MPRPLTSQDSFRVRLLRWLPAIAMMALIFGASSLAKAQVPQMPGDRLDWIVKKTAHMISYGLLGAAYLRGLSGERAANRREVALAVLLAGLYGASDELHQVFSAGRGAAPLDVGIDTLGAALGVAEWLWLRQRAAAR